MHGSTLKPNRARTQTTTAVLALALGAARLAAAEEPREAAPVFDARQREVTPEIALHPNAELPVGADRVVPKFRLAPVDPAELAAAARRREAESAREPAGEAP